MGDAVYALWLEEIAPERLQKLPSVLTLAAEGVTASLIPLPPMERGNCYYQTLTGMGPAKLGRFDAVRPVGYQVHNNTGVPEGASRHLLPEILSANGLTAMFFELGIEDAPSVLAAASAGCIMMRVRDAACASDDALDAVVAQCMECAGRSGHVILLTDVWSPPPRQLINVNDFLAQIGLLETQPGVHPAGEIVWPETLAYGLGAGQVWLNMRGREPQGVVAPGREYDDVRSALIETLRDDWRDPETGEPVLSQVLAREEAFSGEYLFRAPDLVAICRPGYAPSPRAAVLELDGASVHSSGHHSDMPAAAPYALLVGCGPALCAGVEVSGRLIDIVPNLLYLMGQPIPTHVDGRVIAEMFTRAHCEQTPMVQVQDESASLSEEEEGAIVGRLQALGYLG